MFVFRFGDGTGLSRVDTHSLSDQSLMEPLVENMSIHLLKQLRYGSGYFIDACEWRGVECDEDSRVLEIH